jgi:two-component system, sensor histidine kinase
MKDSIRNLLEYFIPEGLAGQESGETYFRARILVMSTLLASVLITISTYGRFLVSGEFSILGVFAATLTLIFPIGLRISKDYHKVSHILPLLINIILPMRVWEQGGPVSPTALWFIVTPAIAFFFLEKKQAIISSMINILIQLAFGIFLYEGHFTNTAVPTKENFQFALVLGIVTVFSTFISYHSARTASRVKRLLKEMNQRAELANKAKDIFWTSMSHEIRTPLNGILGMTNLMIQSHLNRDQRELTEIIRDSAEKLNIILSDVIDYSKLESGEIKVEKHPVNLINLMTQTLDPFRHMAHEKNIALTYLIDSDVPQGILADDLKIKQILTNLLSNSIKFTEKGTIKIIIEKGGQLNTLNFTVEDTGIGITDNKVDKIFLPFAQADEGIDRQFGGVGLGLVICQKLVELLGGKIEVESIYGQGSTFTFSIKALPIKLQQHDEKEYSENFSDFGSLAKVKILVVDDNPVNQKLLVSLLQKSGFDPDVADDGQQALDALELKFYDIIFMDIQMPVMDGITATKEIFKRYPSQRPNIVAVTANVLQEDRDKCFEAGMDDFLTKPINSNILFSILERYTKRIINTDKLSLDFKSTSKKSDLIFSKKGHKNYIYFNCDELLENFSNDTYIIEVIIEKFLENAPLQISNLKTAIQEFKGENIESIAHSLKGTYKSLFSKELTKKCILIEKMGKENKLEDALQAWEELRELNNKLSVELQKFVDVKKEAA